ncbi:hypothetical protein VKT23_019275 [Stygiomarasmius scandens]|uniref:Carrier domain-containing protein n=1 Tax=Marasmiellus scandens TaxID=2682957 RepID=A0ABR1IR45_9AGAR
MVFKPLQLPFYSTALVDRVEKHQCLPDDYWVHHALAPVRFAQTVSRINSASSYDMIMDLGPQRAMWASLQANGLSGIKIIPLRAKAGKDQNLSFLEALSVLYENNISIDFRQLFVGEDGRSMYEKIRLPTYPFQRQRHYPSFIPSRRQTTKQDSFSDANPPSVSYDYPVDQHLCNLLDDHRIDGRRVLPAAGLIYHFCVSPHNEMRSLESIKFHQRFIIDSPFVRAEVSFERKDRCRFSLIQDSDTKICSGIVAPSPIIYPYRQWPSDLAPLYSLTKEEVYNRVRQVAFGPSFQSIQFINVWSDHADGTITVKPSLHPELDAIRKLDACIHMLGGVSPDLVDIPREYFSEGAFLPSSFEGFVVYTDKGILPDSFICRYHLPIQQERNFLVMKTRFEVLSLEGELLAACQTYSVAWIPFSGRKNVTGDAATISWLKTSWRPKSLSINLPPGQEHGFLRRERVLYLANTLNVPLIKALYSSVAKDILFGQLIGGEDARKYHLLSPDDQGNLDLMSLYPRHDSDEFMTIENYLSNKDQKRRVCVVLDTTQAAFSSDINIKPDSHEFSVLCKHILWLMKALVGRQIRFSSFVVISAGGTPSDCKDAGLTLSTIGLGSIVQGMLRVFRREMGLSLSRDMVWGIDVSSRLSGEEWKDIIQSEFYSRFNGVEKDSVVTYRRTGPSETEELLRFVMVQEEMKRDKEEATLRADGVTVIAGMGSIACALTRALVSSGGARKVVLLGRRSEGDKSVREQLSTVLDSTTEAISYIQTDICDINSLRTTFESIEAHQGTIRNIVHAAGVIRDALIQNISSESFEQVISPKVRGGWNLHRVSEEMGLVGKGLDSFVFLSSISVPFGNPGQVAYVAGNSYLDSLAAYRRSRGLPGLSMQLGPWESKLVEQLQFSSGRSLVRPIEHREGIPLLVKALTLTSVDRDDFTASVQLLAKFDSRVMKGIPWIREDPLWDEVTARASDMLRSSNHASEKLWTRKEVEDSIINSLRDVLELREGDLVDLEESLISCGVDSICFAQIQARSISDLGMDIPMAYLSETFTIREMIDYVFGRLEGQSRGMTGSKLI